MLLIKFYVLADKSWLPRTGAFYWWAVGLSALSWAG